MFTARLGGRTRPARRPPPAFFAAAAAIALSVATVARVADHSTAIRALGLGLSAAIIWSAVDGFPPFKHTRARNAVSLQAVGAVAIALSVSWNATGIGLDPVEAVVAAALGAATSAAALAAARAWGFSPKGERTLIVGSGVVADALIAALAREGRTDVVGRIDDGRDPKLLGDLDAFERVVAEQRVSAVIFAYSHASDGRLAQIAERTSELGLATAVVPRLFEQFDQRLQARQVAGMRLLIVDPLMRQAQRTALARVFDVVAAASILLLTLPLWLVVSIAIFVDEPGPILYRAERVGFRGRHFRMLKFRKMRRDAAGPKLTVLGDARFTRIGGFLARTKLDELPQLVNVLRGQMSLVGPRPEDPAYVALYADEFAEILRVRPGITGLSQIHFRDESALLVGEDFDALYRNELLPSKIRLDRYYAKHRSFRLDLRILAWTAVAVFAGARVDRHEVTSEVRFEMRDAEAAGASEKDLAAA